MTCKWKKSVPHPHLTVAGCRHRSRKAPYLARGPNLKPEMPPKACDTTLHRGPHICFRTGITSQQATSLPPLFKMRWPKFLFSKENEGRGWTGFTCAWHTWHSCRSCSWTMRTQSPRSGPQQTTKILPTPGESTGLENSNLRTQPQPLRVLQPRSLPLLSCHIQ